MTKNTSLCSPWGKNKGYNASKRSKTVVFIFCHFSQHL